MVFVAVYVLKNFSKNWFSHLAFWRNFVTNIVTRDIYKLENELFNLILQEASFVFASVHMHLHYQYEE